MRAFKKQVRLAQFSHFTIGGPAKFFYEAKTERDLLWAVREARTRHIPVFILGGGTNLLISEEGFDGLVIKPSLRFITQHKHVLAVGAGTTMDALVRYAAAHALSGLEWAGGLPGTFGGAIRGNAGCFGGETKDTIVLVRSIDLRTGKIRTRTARACRFAYRESVFKNRGGEVIVSAEIRLAPGNKKEIAKVIEERIAYRALHHPIVHPNIGSIFKNVPLAMIHAEGTSRYVRALQANTVSFRGSSFSVKTDPIPVISAGKLISESGLRGVSCGGAMISPLHPNFIVNALGAGAHDVKNLIALAKAEVKKRYGVQLEEEVQLI